MAYRRRLEFTSYYIILSWILHELLYGGCDRQWKVRSKLKIAIGSKFKKTAMHRHFEFLFGRS